MQRATRTIHEPGVRTRARGLSLKMQRCSVLWDTAAVSGRWHVDRTYLSELEKGARR